MFGKPNLQKLIDKRDVRRVADALADNDATIRDHAAQGLLQINDPASVPFVIDVVLVHPGQEEVLAAAVHVLREMGSYSVPVLVGGLRQGQAENRAGYAALLGRLGPGYGLQPLLETSRDTNPAMRAIAAMGLGLLDSSEARTRLVEMVSADDSLEARGYAGFAMATHKLPGTYEALAAQLAADDPSSRGIAATNLGVLGDPRAADLLTQAAEHDADERVRDAARRAASSLGA
jgi:HEAT repeat protein